MKTINQNYNTEFIEAKAGISRLLLHVCCAPCFGNALPKLKGIPEVVCYFYNPNIMPAAEWQRRLNAVETLVDAVNCGKLGEGYGKFTLVVPQQNSLDFFSAVQGKELLGEKTARCTSCIWQRLAKVFEYATKNGFSKFATTLTSSPQKDAGLINAIGKEVGGENYVNSDFKKDGGAMYSKQICQQLGLYRQHYCGCGLPEKAIDRAFLKILDEPFKIGNVELEGRMVLAPMAGYTDVGLRRVASICGAAMTTTEMVSAKGLVHKSKNTKSLLISSEDEKVKAVQIFGSDPNIMAEAVKLPVLDNFDIIDINMGCPMPKIVGNGDGSALMENMELAKQVIYAVKSATTRPVTVKFRKGVDSNIAVEFAKMCEEAGADAICVHGRTRKELYSGNNDFDCIKEVVQNVHIPVIVSGDISSREMAAWALYYTGATAVAVGRAAVGNPGVFGKKIDDRKAIEIQLQTDLKYFGEKRTLLEMKKHLASYFKGLNNSGVIRQKLMSANSIEECLELVKNSTNK